MSVTKWSRIGEAVRAIGSRMHGLLICLAVGAVVSASVYSLREEPEDLESAAPRVVQEPAAVGMVDLVDGPTTAGRFAVRRRPDGPGWSASRPWAGVVVVGKSQIELAGKMYAVVGPGTPGDLLDGETAILAGDPPAGAPWKFRIAPEGGL